MLSTEMDSSVVERWLICISFGNDSTEIGVGNVNSLNGVWKGV